MENSAHGSDGATWRGLLSVEGKQGNGKESELANGAQEFSAFISVPEW